MACPVTLPNQLPRIIRINDEWTRVIDKTKEQAVTVQGFLPQQIHWRGIRIVWEDQQGNFTAKVYSKLAYTCVVEISNGKKPGSLILKEKKLPEDWEKPEPVITSEIDTNSVSWQNFKKMVRDHDRGIKILQLARPLFVAKECAAPITPDQNQLFYQVFRTRVQLVCEEKVNF